MEQVWAQYGRQQLDGRWGCPLPQLWEREYHIVAVLCPSPPPLFRTLKEIDGMFDFVAYTESWFIEVKPEKGGE